MSRIGSTFAATAPLRGPGGLVGVRDLARDLGCGEQVIRRCIAEGAPTASLYVGGGGVGGHRGPRRRSVLSRAAFLAWCGRHPWRPSVREVLDGMAAGVAGAGGGGDRRRVAAAQAALRDEAGSLAADRPPAPPRRRVTDAQWARGED